MEEKFKRLEYAKKAVLSCLKATPQIDTLFRILQPLGYTLEIVPSEPGKA